MTVSNLTDSEAPKIIVSQVKDIANFDQIRLVLCIFETKKNVIKKQRQRMSTFLTDSEAK